jgi:uncharacterized protein YdaU (DUF1376 family)
MAVPYMPLYVADYQADTSHLTTVEHGAYLLLIMCYWQRREKLPDDDRKLARIAGVGPREWARIRPTISEFFQIDRSGWFHSRIQAELDKLQAKSLKKQKGGLARAQQMLSERSARGQLIIGVGEDTVAKATGADAPPDKIFWDGAKAYLGKGKSSKIGQWVRDYGQEETGKAITAAQIARAVDPVPYIERALRGSAKAEPVIGI